MILKTYELHHYFFPKFQFEERTSYARSNGLPVISLDVVKRRGGNVIDVAAKIKELLIEEERNLPEQIYLYFIKFELCLIFNHVILIWHNLCN